MNSSCIDGIKTVFGDVTIKGCEFHYKQCVEKRSRSVQPSHRVDFKARAYELLNASTPEAYNHAYNKMKNVVNNTEHEFLLSRLEWWNSRKSLMSRAFFSLSQTHRQPIKL